MYCVGSLEVPYRLLSCKLVSVQLLVCSIYSQTTVTTEITNVVHDWYSRVPMPSSLGRIKEWGEENSVTDNLPARRAKNPPTHRQIGLRGNWVIHRGGCPGLIPCLQNSRCMYYSILSCNVLDMTSIIWAMIFKIMCKPASGFAVHKCLY